MGAKDSGTTGTTGGTLQVRRFLPWRHRGDEIIALDLTSGRMLTIEGLAIEVWEALVRGTTKAELVKLMCAGRTTSVEEADHELSEWLAELTEAGLLEEPRPAAGPGAPAV